MGRPRRGLEHDQIGRRLDRSDPVAEHGGEPRVGPASDVIAKGVTQMAVAADLDRADLLEVARNGGLGHGITERGKSFGKFFLACKRGAADEIGNRSLSSFLEIGHRMVMHGLA